MLPIPEEKRVKYFFFFFLMIGILSGCSDRILLSCGCGCNGNGGITVLAEVIDRQSPASAHVNAPDPLHEENLHGQRLTLNWCLDKKYSGSRMYGILKVRFKEPKQDVIRFDISAVRGSYRYEVTNQEYFSKKGILSYQCEIFSEDRPVASFQHKMWAELITFDEECN